GEEALAVPARGLIGRRKRYADAAMAKNWLKTLLGIRERLDPLWNPADAEQVLAEAIAWCALKEGDADPAKSLRTPALCPHDPRAVPGWDVFGPEPQGAIALAVERRS